MGKQLDERIRLCALRQIRRGVPYKVICWRCGITRPTLYDIMTGKIAEVLQRAYGLFVG